METGENQSLLNRRESRGCCIRCCRSCCVGCVCSKGILLLLTWSVLIHSFGYYLIFQFLESLFISFHFYFQYYFLGVSVSQAVVFSNIFEIKRLLVACCSLCWYSNISVWIRIIRIKYYTVWNRSVTICF